MKPEPHHPQSMGNHPTSFSPDLIAVDPSTPSAPRMRLFTQVFRFGVVGLINTIVDLAILNFLIFVTRTGQSGAMFALFKTVAFVCAVFNSYLMNRSWTFARTPRKTSVLEGSQFMFVSVLGAVVNVGSSWYVATYAHPAWSISPKWWPSFAALVGTAFSLGFNFIGYKFWVFAHRKN
jgi:putative flippase GtrA